MDQSVQTYDKECMKMAMLKHEQTFKEQVYELHRLYQIQKMLMKNMQDQENICFNYQQQKNKLDLEQPATKDYAQDHVTETLNDQEIEEDECEIELTLGPTSFNRRRRTTNKPESSDSVPSFSSSSTGSSHIKRIERITRENSSFLSGNRRNNSSSSDRSLKQPPWMYQVLSLNMT
ncbi:uncharacterized protein LOC112515394 [Cynara cardunculus var. scolymus]|uniref:Uncharacterized protein n=1 Tax=Cynara cardunculus var. scolymus TaxID=59895 RepID=A0A118JVF5_CYNCS|nr:uncharacterized protein LOC112515394 [Cynara cardunculus var. scolymus]KVH92440.1 hypothetical protein Ccrd_005497 [Cynara cardunculus var. scolymus]